MFLRIRYSLDGIYTDSANTFTFHFYFLVLCSTPKILCSSVSIMFHVIFLKNKE